MIILALGSLILIRGVLGVLGIQQYATSNRRRGKILMFGGHIVSFKHGNLSFDDPASGKWNVSDFPVSLLGECG
jgi:hypothetical protein